MMGGPYGPSSQIYRKQPAVRTVVRFLAANIGQLNPKVYQRVGDDDRRELDSHPLSVLLRNPNPTTTRFRHFRDTVSDIAIYDRAFWEKIRVRSNIPDAVVRIPPANIYVENGEYRNVKTGAVYNRDDLVVFPGYSPDGDDLGVSPIETLRRVLAEEWAAVQNRENTWRNASRQQTVIERPADAPPWGDPERNRFRSDWESMMTGAANSGKTAILEDGMTANTLAAFNAKEMEYIAGRKLTYEEVALAYGGVALAALVVGTQGGQTGASIEPLHKQMYQDVLGPYLTFLQGEIELQLLPDFDVSSGGTRRIYVEFNLAEKLKGSFEEQASVLATSVGVPFMTVNDARSRLNMPRVDDDMFDVPVMPMNVMYGGQQSTQEPTGDPSTPPGLLSRTTQTKAVPRAVERRRDNAAAAHEAILRKFFGQQERVLAAELGRQKALPDAWNDDRWNSELTGLLYAQAVSTTRESGRLAAQQINGVYDEDRTLSYLAERSRFAAAGINETTKAALIVTDDPELVFAVAKSSRAKQIGVTTATQLIAFSREEAARHTEDAQNRKLSKTWVVASAKSRHPEWDGMTAPVGEPFPNGAAYPGDPNLGADQTAGCSCLMIIE